MPHPLSQTEFDTIYARVPRLCVEVIMVEPDGVVLTKRSIEPGAGLWHIPGAALPIFPRAPSNRFSAPKNLRVACCQVSTLAA